MVSASGPASTRWLAALFYKAYMPQRARDSLDPDTVLLLAILAIDGNLSYTAVQNT